MSSPRHDGPDGVPVDHDDLGFSTRAIRAASRVPEVHPELIERGIQPGLLRVSVALEDVDDLKADLSRAFAVAGVGIEAVATAVAT